MCELIYTYTPCENEVRTLCNLDVRRGTTDMDCKPLCTNALLWEKAGLEGLLYKKHV